MLPGEAERVTLTVLPKEGKTRTHKIWVVFGKKGLAWLGKLGKGCSREERVDWLASSWRGLWE